MHGGAKPTQCMRLIVLMIRSLEDIPYGWEILPSSTHTQRIISDQHWSVSEDRYVGFTSQEELKIANDQDWHAIRKVPQYREPVAEDLKDGPIDVECCTPDPDFGSEKWRTRRLISILPADYNNRFLFDHPFNKGIVLRYKKARIKCDGSQLVNPSETSNSSTHHFNDGSPRGAVRHISIFHDGKQDLLELIELIPGQEIFQNDMFQIDGEWKKTGCIGQTYDPSISPDRIGMHQIHYRARLLESRSIC